MCSAEPDREEPTSQQLRIVSLKTNEGKGEERERQASGGRPGD